MEVAGLQGHFKVLREPLAKRDLGASHTSLQTIGSPGEILKSSSTFLSLNFVMCCHTHKVVIAVIHIQVHVLT